VKKKKQKLTKDYKPSVSNFHRHIISSDGNCLYRAILYSLFQDDKDHYQLRLDVCEHIYQNKIEYGPWLFHELDVQDIDQYIQNMKINGKWGGFPELTAASRILQFNFCLYQTNTFHKIYENFQYPKKPTIHLEYFNDNHFNCLIPLGKDEICVDLKGNKLSEYKNTNYLNFRNKNIKSLATNPNYNSALIIMNILKSLSSILKTGNNFTDNDCQKGNNHEKLQQPISRDSLKNKKNTKSHVDANCKISKLQTKVTDLKIKKDEIRQSSKSLESENMKNLSSRDIYPLAKRENNTYNKAYYYFVYNQKPEDISQSKFRDWKKNISKQFYYAEKPKTKYSKSLLIFLSKRKNEINEFTIPMKNEIQKIIQNAHAPSGSIGVKSTWELTPLWNP